MWQHVIDLVGPGGVGVVALVCLLWAARPLLAGRLHAFRDKRELRSYGYGRRVR